MNLRGRAWRWALGATLWLASGVVGACSSSESPAGGAGAAGSGAVGTAGPGGTAPAGGGAGGSAGGATGDASSDVQIADVAPPDGDGGFTCDDCGSPRFTGTCAAAQMACSNNFGCAAILNCVFAGGDAQAACPLGPTGPACVDSCTRAYCTDSTSAALYRALDECAYCTACSEVCVSYCPAFADAGPATCGDI